MAPTQQDFCIAHEHSLVYPPMPLSCISVPGRSGTTPTEASAGMTALWTWILRAVRTIFRTVVTRFRSGPLHSETTMAMLPQHEVLNGTPSSSTVLIPPQTRTITLPPAQPSQILTIYSNDPLRLSLLGTESGSWIIHGPIQVSSDKKWLWWL